MQFLTQERDSDTPGTFKRIPVINLVPFDVLQQAVQTTLKKFNNSEPFGRNFCHRQPIFISENDSILL